MKFLNRIILIVSLLLSTAVTATAQSQRGKGCWRTATARSQAMQRVAYARARAPYNNSQTTYQGTKKGLVILAEFTDKKFKKGNNAEKYNDILNAEGYTSNEGFIGSVADYFRDQSDGQFELQFDVVGPFTTKNDYSYYGENDKDGYDMYADEMIAEMCLAADSIVDFNDYDWDGNGEVDEVFVVYAGKSESDSSDENLIWPHMWTFDEAERELILDGVRINVYACSNEVESSGGIEGIGTFCHEFSHCLGLPDLYDTADTGQQGPGFYDVMDQGCYNGDSFCPAGYSAYEKMACGWLQPTQLTDADMTLSNIKPTSQNGEAFVIVSNDNPDDFYAIENRQKTGWDKYLPKSGLLITHVDYDKEVWDNNIVNSVLTLRQALAMGYTTGNDHRRLTVRMFNSTTGKTAVLDKTIEQFSRNDDLSVNFAYSAGTASAVAGTTITNTDGNAAVYSITGVRLDNSKPLRQGVYIIDGRKVVKTR